MIRFIRSRALAFLTLMVLMVTCGCYGPISGRVVDAETGKPIEGAVVLVEWTITKGLGLSYGEVYKTAESVTSSNGIFKVPGALNPFVNDPYLAVYKTGYVGWSNHYIFPTWERRKDFKYKDGVIIKLQHFGEEYSHHDHVSFISSAAVSGSGGKLFVDAYLWEWKLAEREREERQSAGSRRGGH